MGPLLLRLLESLVVLQTSGATVTGTVRDEATGHPLPNAVVAFTDLNRSAITGPGGGYQFREVPAGPQHLTVRYVGYTPRTLHAIVPRDGELTINVALHPVPLRLPPIEVKPSVPVPGLEPLADEWSTGRTSSMAAVRNHPLLSEPDPLQALSGGEVLVKLESPDGMHIRGGAADQTGYLLDGIPVLSPYHAGSLFSALNPDALTTISLLPFSAAPAFPEVLSGTIEAATRAPTGQTQLRGGISSTQARLTVDGPLGQGIGYLLSVRSAFPGMLAAPQEASYLKGEAGDWIARLEAPILGGRVRLLGYGSGNEINTATVADADEAPGRVSSNSFEWSGRSLGLEWSGTVSGARLTLRGWEARGDAKSSWLPLDAPATLGSSRNDRGLVVQAVFTGRAAVTTGGIRLQRMNARYHVGSDSTAEVHYDTGTPVLAGYGQHVRTMGRVHLTLMSALSLANGDLYPSPALELAWKPFDPIMLSAGVGRSHQFGQSLRNPESVAALVFPPDLAVGAETDALPVARSDQATFSADYRPAAGIRLRFQVWQRWFDELVMVPPAASTPFAAAGLTTGGGRGRGLALEGAVSDARYGITASYSWQRLRFDTGEVTWSPSHTGFHLLETGVIAFPGAATSLRLGVTGAWGRRATPVTGALEFESCNLMDLGCEFGGSPGADSSAAGGMGLPAYFRVDLGVRHHWHLRLAGREASLGLFGTITNVFGRRNLLAYGRDPRLDRAFAIEMRPRAPLVAGVDWQF